MAGYRLVGGIVALLITAGLAVAPIGTHALPGALAQDAGLDLAAMALDQRDLPRQYQQLRFDDEGYTPGDRIVAIQFGGDASDGELGLPEIESFYSSTFFTADESSWIYVYLTEFPTEQSVEAGFNVLEDDERWAAPSEEWRDEAGPESGTDPKEVTIGSHAGPGGVEPALHYIDATFTIGLVLAGVSVTTTGDEPSRELVEELAATLAARIDAVLSGESLAGVDPDLPKSTLNLFKNWPWPGNSLEGYKSAADFLGFEGAPAQFALDFQYGYARFASAGSVEEVVQHEPPYIDVEIAAFATQDAALGVLEIAEELPSRHYGEPITREAATEPSLAGVDAIRAFHTERPSISGNLDSLNLTGYEVVFVAGSHFVSVRIQADVLDTRWTAENLEASVLDLAAQQLDCLNSSQECGPAQVPEALSDAGGPATPVALVHPGETQ